MQQKKTFLARLIRILGITVLVLGVVFGGYAVYRFFTFEQTIFGVPESQALILPFYESMNAKDYDPHQITSASDEIHMLYSGLVALDKNYQVLPDIAERWDISSNGMVYTFHMRKNAVFHDGSPVTAADVKYSLERAASPALASQSAPTYLNDIEGFEAYNAGDINELTGVRTIDAHTIEITIDAPKPYFLYKLTYPTGYILDRTNVNQGQSWFLKPNGTGPYRLTDWGHSSYMLFTANDKFYLQPPAIPYVVLWMSDSSPQDLYEQNYIDVTSTWDVDRFSRSDEPLHEELVTSHSMCTSYVVFDTTQPPFDDVHVRRALSMATDRNRVIEKLYLGRATANYGVFPQGLPGFNAVGSSRVDLQACKLEYSIVSPK